MESVTYVCYSKEDLDAQAKVYTDELQSIKEALWKVAQNNTNAATLEEIKALLGMTAEDTTSAPSQSKETTTEGANTEDSATDTKSTENTVTEPSTSVEPHTNANGAPNTVTVQPGDTLQTIAEKTGTNPRHLIDMNMLMEPVVLRPGQALKF